jgi:hypothetical protein
MVSDGRPPVPYDVLSIDVGSSPRLIVTQEEVWPGCAYISWALGCLCCTQ